MINGRGNKATLIMFTVPPLCCWTWVLKLNNIPKGEIKMKKSLVLAMAMALGVTASAYAANPFSDVPAGHWAYDSVAELAAAGVVDGYGDGTFGGDKLMTRYEMAQIVAKAMANGANVDKLAAEFADELDNLGVRVANLEKKADNVKIAGEVRYLYTDSELNGNEDNNLRTRLWVNGQINDDWSYTGMIENTQDFTDNGGNDDTEFARAYVEGKLGGMNVTAGRYSALFANGNVYDANVDGAEVVYGNKVQLRGFAGKATDAEDDFGKGVSMGNYAGAEVTAALGENFNLMGGYVNYKDIYEGANWKEDNGVEVQKAGLDNAVWYVGADFSFGDFTLNGMYLKGDMSYNDVDEKVLDDDGFVVGLNFKGAEAAEVGSYGLFANYYDQGGQTYLAHTTDANTFGGDGFKGYGVGLDYTVAKNMVATVAYYDTESKVADADGKTPDDQIIWSALTFSF